jgi:hypothetical protein
VYLSAEELFYIRLNGRICTKKNLSVPPSGRHISIRWNGSKNYMFSLVTPQPPPDRVRTRLQCATTHYEHETYQKRGLDCQKVAQVRIRWHFRSPFEKISMLGPNKKAIKNATQNADCNQHFTNQFLFTFPDAATPPPALSSRT